MKRPSLHDVLLELLRQHSDAAARLASRILGLPLPRYDRIVASKEVASAPVGVPIRADLVLTLYWEGEPVLTIVFEHQLWIDRAKRSTWPLYLVSARHDAGCDAWLIILTTDETIERWARTPIAIGHPGFELRPLVLGPSSTERLTDPKIARSDPLRAVLSALVHGPRPGGEELIAPTRAVLSTLETPTSDMVFDILLRALPEEARQLWRVAMIQDWEYSDEFKKFIQMVAEHKARNEGRLEGEQSGRLEGEHRGRLEGRLEGERSKLVEAILAVLDARQLAVSSEVEERLRGVTEIATLEALHRKAVLVRSAKELFGE